LPTAFLSFDAVSLPLLQQLMAEGRLPNCSDLFRRGQVHEIKPTPFHASVYRDLYTGHRLSTHGMYYPQQWCAAKQRIQPADTLNPDDTVFALLDNAGKRTLLIDPPEFGRFNPRNGLALSGWQFHARFVLPQWCSSTAIAQQLKQQFGRSPSCHEVFGQPSLSRLATMRRVLEAAPQRLADATTACLKNNRFDFAWVTFVSPHIGGHQFWNTSLPAIYEALDDALGKIVSTLPPSTNLILLSPNGMGPETSRADLLPAMLKRILHGNIQGATSSPLWRLRAILPTGLRAALADAIPDSLALNIASRLDATKTDWTATRAFALPTDGPGFIRLNLKGREREGIVAPEDATHLAAQISAGLKTFIDPDGDPIVEDVIPSAISNTTSLPDLVVLWAGKPSSGLTRIVSPQFGEVLRTGAGSGRTGNHCDGAWACIIPGDSHQHAHLDNPIENIDLAATACATLDVEHAHLPGRPLLIRKEPRA
jgi:hypothetical protein